MKVGVREFRDHLSRYLNQVESGDEVIVTDHGREIARVMPIENGGRRPSACDRLVAEGLAAAPLKARRPLPARGISSTQPLSPLVSEQRG
ncbi:MAG TPA: type II toxin-antitoxin system prevent-host-death family antitoxin [Acidimicrobiales bacterium]|nr:type II toxin-antitoxin system prevent-host-death family antitoxin [Acidimicrobiales bacterium]